MLLGKKTLYIKRAGYGKATRGGVNWLKWFFDNGGFWLYLAAGIILIFASNNRPNTDNLATTSDTTTSDTTTAQNNSQASNSDDEAPAVATGDKTNAIAAVPGVMAFTQVLTSNLGQGAAYITSALGNLIYANEENKQLRKDLTDYNLLKQQVAVLERENLELSKLLKFEPSKTGGNYVTARIIGDAGASGRQTWLINRGANDGITQGAFAVDDHGLVGVVIEVARNSARILRLSDPNFYLPVTVNDRKFRAVLRGNGSPIATLDYFDGLDRPAVGEEVLSTGSGGNFPPFLPIGTIYDKKFGDIGVLIFAEKNPPIYVKIYKP
ncbi:MAG: rod shape-determining protein MreC [Hydrotalea sp.]|nr:rod shape-determining protein MreC [Hydrotalea sp.]